MLFGINDILKCRREKKKIDTRRNICVFENEKNDTRMEQKEERMSIVSSMSVCACACVCAAVHSSRMHVLRNLQMLSSINMFKVEKSQWLTY